MAFRHLVAELFYGAGLLAAITAAPEILMMFRMNHDIVSTVTYRFPKVGFYMIGSLLITAFAMLPVALRQPNFFTRHPRLAPTPWILICCIKFLLNFKKYLFAIREVERYNNPRTVIMALIMYCIIFSQAIELMLHWFGNRHLRIDIIDIE